ncbi:MAG: FmdB family zinc ribbon protein [Acidobacteriota bacterium]
MPLYEYQCTQCRERTEILQRTSDPPFTHCPKCGGEVKKLFSSPSIQFKGSGFYKTDYATTSTAKSSDQSEKFEESEKSEKSEKSEAKSESSTGDAKTEKKPSE